MYKLCLGLAIYTTFGLAGCLSTQYGGPYEESYEPVVPIVQSVETRRPNSAIPRVTPATYTALRCPAGTRPHAKSGTCLMDAAADTSSAAPSTTRSAAPRWQNIVSETKIVPRSTDNSLRQDRPYGNYKVKTGDTVYALARARCLPVATVQAVNNLDSTYAIRIGQDLHLPASRC